MLRCVPCRCSLRACACQVTLLLHLVETCLAIIFYHLWRKSGDLGTSRVRRALPDAPPTGSCRMKQPCALQELDQLKRHLLPILHQLDTLEGASVEQDLSSVHLLVRRAKDRLV